jgi:hypothetical protein
LEESRAYQLLVSVLDISLLDINVKKKTKVLLDISKDANLELNTGQVVNL